MKPPENSLYHEDWKEAAKKDWNRILIMLKEEDTEAAAYFLQQALEKYLKAYLFRHGWKLRKIHRLDALLDDAIKHNSALESFRKLCERVSGYYLTERYPKLVSSGLTTSDIEKDVEETRQFIKTLFGDIP